MQTLKDQGKKAAGYAAAALVEDDMHVGLGTGTTAAFFIEHLAERCRKGLKILAFSSSEKSLQLAVQGKIPTGDINQLTTLDFTADGADEIDRQFRMIKGGGGALLREKIIASMSKEMVIIIDNHKLVERLGKFPLPVEITQFGWKATCNQLQNLNFFGKLREKSDKSLFITDNGNYIYDITFPSPISDPEPIDKLLKDIPGVMETGFFFNLAKKVLIGYPDGKVDVRQRHEHAK
ncbi:MAG: ribose 5-phosphate isomerase A [Parachlamydiaceae bacterium]|nr:ribose 5-phosphate isomerase A [Parachlamydiaceae bacterium]